MNSPSAVSWQEFPDEIEAARANLGCSEPFGDEPWIEATTERTIHYSLRCFDTTIIQTVARTGIASGAEQDLVWEFSVRASELHGASMSDWDILFAMRHDGSPTRLLDWTEALGVPVFFALHSYATSNKPCYENECLAPCVWVLNPYRHTKYSWDYGNVKTVKRFVHDCQEHKLEAWIAGSIKVKRSGTVEWK
jgi:hypothetical protein